MPRSMPRRAARRLASRRPLAGLADERLVVLVRRGDESAFEELFDRHSAGVLSFCIRFLCSREEGEDAHQHAFLAAYQAIAERGLEPRAFKPWLYAIARNRCLSVLRAPREATLPPDEESAAAAEQTAERVEQRAEVRELLSDVRDLPDQQRAALLLAEICDLSHAQVAQVIACPRAKVKSLVFQARASLSLGREVRETPCGPVREELAGSSGSRLPLALRRHVKRCEGCREFASESGRRRQLTAIALPVAPSIGLKHSTLAALGGSGGGGAGGGGLAAGLVAKGAALVGASAGASGATACGGLGAALIAKAGLVAGATAGVTALSLAGTGAIAERPQAQDRARSASASERSSDVVERTSMLRALVPGLDGRAPALERGQHPGRWTEAPQRPSRQASAALPPPELDREGGSPEAPPAASAPVPDRGTPRPEKSDHGVRGPKSDHGRGGRHQGIGGPQSDHGDKGPKPDHDDKGPKPDYDDKGPKPDHGEMACEQRGGRFVDVSRQVYACVFASPSRQRRDHGERTCERSAGRFVDVSPLVYACVLPGGTLPDPFPVLS